MHRPETGLRDCLTSAVVLLAVAAGMLTSSSASDAQGLAISVGTVVGFGAVVGALAGEFVDQATGDIRSLLEQIHTLIDELTTRLSDTYRGLLDTTLDQLGEETRQALEGVYSTFQKIYAELQVGIADLTAQLLTILKDALLGLRASIAQAEEAARAVVADAADIAVFVVGLILVGITLLVAVRTAASGRLAGAGRKRVVVSVLLILSLLGFGTLLVGPGRRALYRIAGLRMFEPVRQPMIFEVRPATIVAGRTKEVLIFGTALAPDGNLPDLTIAGVPVPIAAGGNGVLAAPLGAVELSGRTGPQTLQLRTAGDDGKSEATVVRIESRRPLPRVTAWTITPIGARWENRGSTTRRNIGCEAPGYVIGKTLSCSFSELIIVPQDSGYVLDVSKPAQLGRGSGETVDNDGGDARAGFREDITTYRPRHGSPRYPRREINYHPDASRPIGVRVSGSARNDARTDPNRARAEFRADYTVYARWRNPDSAGRTWTFSGACDISGPVTCGAYPYPQELGEFAGNLRYLTDVTLQGADGALQHRNASLTPGAGSAITVPLTYETADGGLTAATYTFQIVQNTVRVSGPQVGPTSPIVVSPQLGSILERLRARRP